jgi:uncharacterized protein (DUF433 family)
MVQAVEFCQVLTKPFLAMMLCYNEPKFGKECGEKPKWMSSNSSCASAKKGCGMETQRLLERITIDPEICHGKPCIRNLRYPVEVILELLSAGMTSDQILADYEDLEYEDILAALAFATRLSQVKRLETVLG